MNSRERVFRTLRFEPTDRPPYDLMEGAVWPELQDFFCRRHGLDDAASVVDFLDTDFRWAGKGIEPPETGEWFWQWVSPDYEIGRAAGPLAAAETVADVEAYRFPDPSWWPIDGLEETLAAAKERWPDKVLVYGSSMLPLFWTSCEVFGAEEALVKMVTQPRVYSAFVQRLHEAELEVHRRRCAIAGRYADVCHWWDDFASQQSLLISPKLWRQHIKPYLAEQFRVARENGMLVFFHSCGAVRPVLPDLIEMGASALVVFQTRARGMDAESIAREFGGHLAFYGGVDVQHLLSFGTPEQVADEVQRNVRAFGRCGGYIVANSHHGVETIRGENLEAMCRTARLAPRHPQRAKGPRSGA
jgi:uroporphyrinogen decarboxylase